MPKLQMSDRFRDLHSALAARLAGFGEAILVDSDTMLVDAAESGNKGIAVRRGDTPSLDRDDAGRRLLTYTDPSDDHALTALIACIGEAGGAVAADAESLSVLALAERLASTDIPVLVGGATGTGKEVLSRFIHAHSPRAKGPFIAVNCAAIPETMLEAMLFGHAKGSFTGANAAGEGFFRAAEGGTLMLDEIAEMPLSLQAKLLRALQESEVVPVGATRPIKVDVRIVAAANRDLPEEVAQGRFREDLFYRLNVFPITLKNLCDRPADIAPLAFAMLLRRGQADGGPSWFSEGALASLQAHRWPGNVRELENVVRRALVMAAGKPVIEAADLVFDQQVRAVSNDEAPAHQAESAGGKTLSKVVQISEAKAILNTLDACNGKRVEAAKRLGISERTLRYRLASMREAGLVAGGAA